jgi:DMSO/TMAO reductase YedYZ heme-binding membrane subunit
MDKISKKKYITASIVILYFAFFLIYAYIRYIHFKGLDFLINANFIINKAFAGAAILSVSTSYFISSMSKFDNIFAKSKLSYKRFFGLSGFYFMMLHIFFGFRIIRPDLLPQFFSGGVELSAKGKLIILLGILGFTIFLFPAISSMSEVMKKLSGNRWLLFQRLGYLAFTVIMIHASLIGYENWISPNDWPGMMPPITLICVIIIFSILLLRLTAKIIKNK